MSIVVTTGFRKKIWRFSAKKEGSQIHRRGYSGLRPGHSITSGRMLTVEHYELIRRKVVIEGKSQRDVAKELRHSHSSWPRVDNRRYGNWPPCTENSRLTSVLEFLSVRTIRSTFYSRTFHNWISWTWSLRSFGIKK